MVLVHGHNSYSCTFGILWSTKLQYHLITFTVAYVERLKLIREQRAEAAKKREEEKAGKFLGTSVRPNLSGCFLVFTSFRSLTLHICHSQGAKEI